MGLARISSPHPAFIDIPYLSFFSNGISEAMILQEGHIIILSPSFSKLVLGEK